MSNTSATGGYLEAAETPAPLEGQDLDRFLQQVVSGITGIPGELVRPRWQANPPVQPDVSVNWCSIGVLSQTPDAGPYIGHDPAGEGSDEMQRHEVLEIMASMYGPSSRGNAACLRDGLALPQNCEVLQQQNMGLVEVGPIIAAPDLVNTQWIQRRDVTFRVRRQIGRTYPILNILSASGEITTGGVTNPFTA